MAKIQLLHSGAVLEGFLRFPETTQDFPSTMARRDLFFFFVFFPGLGGLPLPTTPSTKRARAGQLKITNK